MAEDPDDTVLVPPRTHPSPREPDTADTVLTKPGARPARRPVPAPGMNAASPSPAAARPAAPATYAIRVAPTGEVVSLDQPCLIGRDPRPPRISRGPALRLVTVPSPHREVSATHLEARQHGATVVLTDLKSTNGTIVLVPGNAPRTLRQGETVVVSPGTLVDLGDDVVLHILSARTAGIDPAGRLT